MELFVRKKMEPIILIAPDVIAKTDFLVGLAKKEVGWLGTVEEIAPFKYFISDIHLFKQEVTGTETDIDATALGEFFSDHIEVADKIRFWGHSHVNMGVSPSSTDINTIQELQGNGAEFFIMGIFNKKQESRFDVYVEDYIFKNVSWRPHFAQVDVTDLKREYDEKVTEKVYQSHFNQGGNYNYNYNYNKNKNTGTNQYPRNYDLHDGIGGLNHDYDPITTGAPGFSNPPVTSTSLGAPDAGHKTPPTSIRSIKGSEESTGGRGWMWGNGKQNNNESGKAGDKKSKGVGQGQNRGTQHTKPTVPPAADKPV